MKLLLVVFSLVILYWACISYAEEDTDSKGVTINSKEGYTSNYQDVSWGRSLSRSKRSLITPLLNLFGKSFRVVMKPIIDLCLFTFEVLLGERECSDMGDVTKDLFPKIGSISIQMIKIIICHIANMIGRQGRALLLKIIDASILFIRKVFLPALHTILNSLKNTGILPPSFVAMINAFNMVYSMLKMLGYV